MFSRREKQKSEGLVETRNRKEDVEHFDYERLSPVYRTPFPDMSSSPFAMMGRLMSEMDRAFESFGMGGPFSVGSPLAQGWSPHVEAFVRDGKLVVRADLPGLSPDQVSLQVDKDVLTISGERRDDRTEQREGYWHSERSYGRFQRSLALPEGTDPDAIEAKFEQGVLEVTAPLPEPKQRGRSIPIQQHVPELPVTAATESGKSN